jgi:hypothetical protein
VIGTDAREIISSMSSTAAFDAPAGVGIILNGRMMSRMSRRRNKMKAAAFPVQPLPSIRQHRPVLSTLLQSEGDFSTWRPPPALVGAASGDPLAEPDRYRIIKSCCALNHCVCDLSYELLKRPHHIHSPLACQEKCIAKYI